MTLRALAALTTLALGTVALAAPAPWYVWRSTLDGQETCAQTLQGAWVKVRGPYRNAGCAERGLPGR
jgi:hypothetical protein